MQLKITLNDFNAGLDFAGWLKENIRQQLIASINIKKLQSWDIFLNKQSSYKSIYKKKIIPADIIIAAANNLVIKSSESKYSIMINPNIFTFGLDRVKLSSLCRLINYGNQEIKGYSIFTEVFKHFSDNIESYLTQYLHNIM